MFYSFSIVLAILDLLLFHINFKISLPVPTLKPAGILRISILKVKEPVILLVKWNYLGIAEELKFGTCKLLKTCGKSRDQRRGTLLYREKEKVGSCCFEQKSIGRKQEFKVVMFSHWLNCDIFLLAELIAGKVGFPPPGGVQ